MFDVVETVLSSAVAVNGTFTVNYPTNRNSGSYTGAYKHKMKAMNADFEAPSGFTVSFGSSSITVTYKGSTTIPAGTRVRIQFDRLGDDEAKLRTDVADTYRTVPLTPYRINLGAAIASDDDGVSASASITAAAGATIGGALASGGVATFDVPRNVIITSAGDDSAKTFTVTGTDEYGNTVKENITGANAGIASGKKAFKTVTAVAISSNSASTVKIGTGDVLGLPVALPQTAQVLKEIQDGVVATAGTVVAAVRTAASATTGDVRGTYDPNAACDGSKAFELLVLLSDPTDKGVTQYSG